MKITSEEIAKLAHVSRSTVSRVINNYPNVPDETRKKIMEIIEKYEYEPHSSARVLAGKANKNIVLCISDYNEGRKRWRGSESPFFMRLIAELVSAANQYGYVISVSVVSSKSDYSKFENMFLNKDVTAGIFIGFEFDFQMDTINQFIDKGFSMVVIDPGEGMKEADNVTGIYSEDEKAGYIATSFLLAQGHKRVAHLAGDSRLSARHRLEGYARAMEEAGMGRDESLIRHGNFESELAYKLALELLRDEKATAVYAANDTMAISAMRAAKDLGYRIPEDIAVIGCDYTPFFETVGYYLTSIKISVKTMADMAVKAALGLESSKTLYCQAEFKPGDTA